jgi:hypothetical protein
MRSKKEKGKKTKSLWYSPTNWWKRVLAAGKRNVHGRFWRYEQTNRANGCFQAILPQSGVQGKRTKGARQYRDPWPQKATL